MQKVYWKHYEIEKTNFNSFSFQIKIDIWIKEKEKVVQENE
jgi:hypothetical protein